VTNDREIRMRAYEIWQGLGRPVGHAVEHRVEAERQLDEENFRTSEDDAELESPSEEKKGIEAARGSRGSLP